MRIFIAGLFALAAAAPSIAADLQGPARVIDGDTIEVAGPRVRLHGIDAPEADQTCRVGDQEWRCGRDATAQLAEITSGQDVRCEGRDQDRYGRIVAVCFVGDTDLNAWLASEGWALAYRKYSLDYVDEEDRARASRRGLWRGEFTPPWDWRRGARQAANESVAGKCLIKGNISSKGERIYHVPGGQYYERTKISTAKGERWFCTEAEARAVVWRASQR